MRSGREPPRQLLLSHGLDDLELMAAALAEKAGRKVEILIDLKPALDPAKLDARLLRDFLLDDTSAGDAVDPQPGVA